MIRFLFRCKKCRHPWAFEYAETGKKGRPFERAWIRPSDSASMTREPRDDAWAGCPSCGSKSVKGAAVAGEFSEKHKCGRTCTEATGARCKCSCGGARHGIAHLQEPSISHE